MDLKNVLQAWKDYQKYKLKMANSYSCTLTFSFSGVIFPGNLSFITSGEERRIEFRDPGTSMTYNLLLRDILGIIPENSMIRFTLTKERFVTAHFPTEALQNAALEAYLVFEREEFGLTPSSSNDSD